MGTARVGKLPGPPFKEVEFRDGDSAADVLRNAGLSTDGGYECRVNGSSVPLNTRIRPGDQVLLVKKVKGQ